MDKEALNKDIILTYEKIVTSMMSDREYYIKDNELICCCPFHDDTRASFGINLTTGQYNCFSCNAKGGIVKFISELKGISQKEALLELGEISMSESANYYTVEMYAKEKKLDAKWLKEDLGIQTDENATSISIPYFNSQGYHVATRHRNNPNNKTRFHWDKNSKSNLYGLWFLKDMPREYIVLVEGESDCHALWSHDILAIGVPGATNFKKQYADIFSEFEKIYIHSEDDAGAQAFIKKICQSLPYGNLYKISSRAVDENCKDPSDLHINGLLDKDKLLATAIKVDRDYYNEINFKDEIEKHVEIAEKVLDEMDLRFYNENFCVYKDGVYKKDLSAIEQCILSVDNNCKKNLRAEILDYLRITQNVGKVVLDSNLINFKNGLYDISNNTLESHTPEIFSVCQINADYLNDEQLNELIKDNKHIYIEKFFDDICCNDANRKNTLLEFLGYSMTYRTNLEKCLFLWGETAGNGKSTYISLIIKMIGEDNISSVSIEEFSERFFGSELSDKLLNIVHETKELKLKDIGNIKKVISGNELSVEEKYKNRYVLKPFTHHIYAMNSLPELAKGGDEGFFRRLLIVKFENKFTAEQKAAFDFNSLISKDSLNYLANIALRNYLKLDRENNGKFSGDEESESIINEYKAESNSAIAFINNEKDLLSMLDNKYKISKKQLYDNYYTWCFRNKADTMSKKDFFRNIMSSGKFCNAGRKNGYDCVKYVAKDLPSVNFIS